MRRRDLKLPAKYERRLLENLVTERLRACVEPAEVMACAGELLRSAGRAAEAEGASDERRSEVAGFYLSRAWREVGESLFGPLLDAGAAVVWEHEALASRDGCPLCQAMPVGTEPPPLDLDETWDPDGFEADLPAARGPAAVVARGA